MILFDLAATVHLKVQDDDLGWFVETSPEKNSNRVEADEKVDSLPLDLPLIAEKSGRSYFL